MNNKAGELEPDTDSLKCTCFRIRRASRRLTQVYEMAMREACISPVQMAVLTELARDQCAVTVNQLADRLGTDRTTLSRTLTRMCEAGWLTRATATDGRMRVMELTDLGNGKLDEAMRGWRRAESALLSVLGSDTMKDLYQSLDKLEHAAVKIEQIEQNRRQRVA